MDMAKMQKLSLSAHYNVVFLKKNKALISEKNAKKLSPKRANKRKQFRGRKQLGLIFFILDIKFMDDFFYVVAILL